MDVRRLRLLTVVAPIAYLMLLELVGLFVLRPLFGYHSSLRLIILFALLAAGIVPFSFWVFATIERQQRDLARNAAVLAHVKDYAIFMLDPAGKVATWNPEAERIKGFAADEVIGQHVSRFYLREDIDAGEPDRNLRLAATKGRVEDEGWRVRKDGTLFWANIVSSAVRDEAGNLVGYTHVVRDMTERKRAEDRIKALNDELEERIAELAAANQEIVLRNQELAAVNTAIGSVSAALDLSSVLQSITDAACDLVHSRYAALGVADEHGVINRFITSGITAEQRAAIGPLPRGHGLLATLIGEGKPLRVRDISSDPRSYGFPPNHPPMKNLLGVPILFQGEPVGDLYLTDKIGAEEFSREDQDLLMLLAKHAAVAIENARLYEEVRAARDELQVWNEELEAKVAERTQEIQRYSKELTTRVLRAQEEERKRIARELHDETAQSLSTLLINLDLLEPQVPADDALLRAGFDRVRGLAKRTLDETRALSHDLRPTILDDFGLVAAIHWFADQYAATFGVPVEVKAEHEPTERLNPELELALFRITQEALTNSGKYAEAEHVCVSLSFDDEMARLEIADDGRGFDLDKVIGPTRQGGLGLYGMKERAELIGATLAIDSAPGGGTKISVTTPLMGSDESWDELELVNAQEI